MKIFIGYLKCNNWREWLFSERNFKPAVLEGLRNLLSKLQQKIVALLTTEAEYVAIIEASKELIWLQGLLTKL